jgi:hypothetical protein
MGLYLTAGCAYETSNFPPAFTIVSDGTWMDAFQTPNALDFVGITGPAASTMVKLRPLRRVLPDPCNMGSVELRQSTPSTSREYLDWLGGFIDAPAQAVEVGALGLHGWRFESGRPDNGPTPNPDDPCAFVSLAEASPADARGSTEALAINQFEHVRVYVLDSPDGVFLVLLSLADQPASDAAGEAFLAGIHAKP